MTPSAPLRPCSTPGCGTPTSGSRCDQCAPRLRADSDRRRPNASRRGYTSRGHRRFREAVLARDPICVLCRKAASAEADHWPLSRKQLIAQGADPNDPERGRGLCHRCHSSETARHQPGGWNARRG